MLYPLSYEGRHPDLDHRPDGSGHRTGAPRGDRGRGSGRVGGARYPSQMARTVLVVDDDPVILRLLEVNFEMEGFAVIGAVDGITALELARSAQPDVIVSDVMMPRMTGLEMVSELRADDSICHIPVLLLSAKAQVGDVRAGLAAGADDYVTKPFEPLELVERVAQLLLEA
jgi:DNA-binding response OmpR family regulator